MEVGWSGVSVVDNSSFQVIFSFNLDFIFCLYLSKLDVKLTAPCPVVSLPVIGLASIRCPDWPCLFFDSGGKGEGEIRPTEFKSSSVKTRGGRLTSGQWAGKEGEGDRGGRGREKEERGEGDASLLLPMD